MEYRNEIGNGYELGDLLWSGARTNFGEWLDKGADADDILSCVEEYLGYGEELPTLTEINDFLWFEPETVESYLGLSSDNEDEEIESARKNKSIKSSDKVIKNNFVEKHGIYHNDTWKLEVVDLEGNTAILKPVKSDDYFVVENPEIDEEGDLVWTSDSLPMTDYDTALKEFNYHKDLKGKEVKSSRKPVKSSGLNFEGGNPYAGMVRNPWGMKKQKSDMIDEITEDDISKAIETIRTSPESTWYKKLYSFGDGTSLYFAAGMGEGYDEDDVVCGKIACLPDNSAMSEYNYDFLMPYNPDTGDVYDTDSELTQGSANWYNDSAKTIIEMINNGELVTK